MRFFIRLFPLYNGSAVTHFLCCFEQAFNFPSISASTNNHRNSVIYNTSKGSLQSESQPSSKISGSLSSALKPRSNDGSYNYNSSSTTGLSTKSSQIISESSNSNKTDLSFNHNLFSQEILDSVGKPCGNSNSNSNSNSNTTTGSDSGLTTSSTGSRKDNGSLHLPPHTLRDQPHNSLRESQSSLNQMQLDRDSDGGINSVLDSKRNDLRLGLEQDNEQGLNTPHLSSTGGFSTAEFGALGEIY